MTAKIFYIYCRASSLKDKGRKVTKHTFNETMGVHDSYSKHSHRGLIQRKQRWLTIECRIDFILSHCAIEPYNDICLCNL